MFLGVTLLLREILEAKAGGGASTVKVEAVVCTTLTAHSEPYNRRRDSRKVTEFRADARRSFGGREWGGRENA